MFDRLLQKNGAPISDLEHITQTGDHMPAYPVILKYGLTVVHFVARNPKASLAAAGTLLGLAAKGVASLRK